MLCVKFSMALGTDEEFAINSNILHKVLWLICRLKIIWTSSDNHFCYWLLYNQAYHIMRGNFCIKGEIRRINLLKKFLLIPCNRSQSSFYTFKSSPCKTNARLTHFSPMSHFYTPWKRTFSGGIEMWHWTKMG